LGELNDKSKREITKTSSSGYFHKALPCNRAGHGSIPLVIFQRLMFENNPQSGMTCGYNILEKDYTLYAVLRKPGI
jgi:hypothetical protein